jgi:hypothetical protein
VPRWRFSDTRISYLPIGLRGVGKTVLLNRFSEIAEQEGIEAGFIEAPEGEDFKSLLANRLRKILLALDGGGSLSEDSKGTSGVEEFSDALRATATGVRPTAADEGLTKDFRAVAEWLTTTYWAVSQLPRWTGPVPASSERIDSMP